MAPPEPVPAGAARPRARPDRGGGARALSCLSRVTSCEGGCG
eukprot:CAMPEP_0206235288 /NCGR_PEP_ID=MMETSP0047_2-20121206/13066_1 /ASSEMBLY_ACC=CAM_ASM_000192 /TAXON_ID=195065 /ORGANISM="Chroomonas mesostigmatica_cf, Strain CCMP1168" /LENGTH=41 /DNA_ID= /DNA_START= /DNA_END= /DNA_ORIENTATION=